MHYLKPNYINAYHKMLCCSYIGNILIFSSFSSYFFVSYGLILFHFHKLIHRNDTA